MDKCSVCGTAVPALHSNAKLGISEVCSDCFVPLANRWNARRAAQIAAAVAKVPDQAES